MIYDTKRKSEYLGLDNIDVYFNDSKSEYIQVFDLPEILSLGKNSFLISFISEYFNSESDIKIEILDIERNPITLDIAQYIEGKTRRVNITVYNENISGLATITILGSLKKTLKNKSIPEKWKNLYNIKWQKNILIDKARPNVSQIRFYETPTLNCNILSKETPDIFLSSSIITGNNLKGWWDNNTNNYKIKSKNMFSCSEGVIQHCNISIPNLEFESEIDDIISLNKGVLHKIYTIEKNNQIQIKHFINEAFTMSYYYYNNNDLEDINNSEDYINFNIEKLETMSGRVHNIKVYVKNDSNPSSDEWKLLGDSILENKDILINNTKFTNQYIGHFYTQSWVDENWKLEIYNN